MNVTLIPGTKQPLPQYNGNPRIVPQSDAELRQRRGLLAKIHIAKKEMGLNEGEYEMVLRSFKASSSAELTIPQLENMVKLLKHYGWKEVIRRGDYSPEYIPALRNRCLEVADIIPNGENRLSGLVLKICKVSNLKFCQDARKLERLLAVLGKIKNEECP